MVGGCEGRDKGLPWVAVQVISQGAELIAPALCFRRPQAKGFETRVLRTSRSSFNITSSCKYVLANSAYLG